MSFDKPSSLAHWQSSVASGSEKTSQPRTNRTQPSVWGLVPQNTSRRGLEPLATSGLTSTARRPPSAASPDPYTNTSSPVGSATSAALPLPNRLSSSRQTSSASSNPSPFAGFQTGGPSQQSIAFGQNITSPRSRTDTPLSQLANAASTNTHSQGGGPGAGGGIGSTGVSRGGTYSPSFPGTNIGSPTTFNFERSTAGPSSATSATPGQSSLSKISVAQVLLLLDTISDKEGKAKWDSKAEQIRKLVESNGMDVYSKYFRRLVSGNAAQIFPGTSFKNNDNAGSAGSYPILQDEMGKVVRDASQAPKIAESIDTADGDVFRDFDLAKFIDHFNLDPIAQTILASAFKACSRSDLRNKADTYLSELIPHFLNTLSTTRESNRNLTPSVIADLVERLATLPPRNFGYSAKRDLGLTVRHRFQNVDQEVPPEVMATLQLLELPDGHDAFLQRLRRDGPRSTASQDAAEDLLASIGLDKLNELEVSNALLFMVLSTNTLYNPSTFISAIRSKSRVKRLDWQQVIRGFDFPKFEIGQASFLRLFNVLIELSSEEKSMDIQFLWGGKWQNPTTQLSFLKAYLFCSAEEIDTSRIPNFRVALLLEDLTGLSPETASRLEALLKSHLSSADAIQAVFDLALGRLISEPDSQQIRNHLAQHHLTEFTLSAFSVSRPWAAEQQQFIRGCFGIFLSKQSPDYRIVFETMSAVDKELVFEQCWEVFASNPLSSSAILECAKEFGWLDDFLRHSSPLALDLACMLHRDGDYDIEQYVRQGTDSPPDSAMGSMLIKFLKVKADDEFRMRDPSAKQEAPLSVGLAVKTVFTLLEILRNDFDDVENFISLQRLCVAEYPRLINYDTGFDEIIDKTGQRFGNSLPAEVEKKMQELFGKMYRDELTLRAVLEILRQHKISKDPDEQDLFACVIHGLFDEYHCYNEYPIDALKKTATLFGGIINFKLMTGIALQVGLGLVLEAVRNYQPEQSMYKFGVEALEQLASRLHEWPGFCGELITIPQLRNTSLYQKAQEIYHRSQAELGLNGDTFRTRGGDSLDMANGNFDELEQGDGGYRTFSAVRCSPPTKGKFRDPEQAVQEKTIFVINNLSEENLPVKVNDIKDSLKAEYYQWFASYLVQERVRLEPIHQKLYIDLLDKIGEKTLTAEVLRETFTCVVKIINAEATVNSSTERDRLKNLGQWIGSLTLAKDIPIKHKDLYFADLLIEAYDMQKLAIVIPFTCKVLDQSKHSMVFKPPNPWLMELIGILMELYHFGEISTLNKFAIEVLCRELKLDYKLQEASRRIRDRPQQLEDEFSSLPGMPDNLDMFDDLTLGGMSRGMRNERLSPAAIMASLPPLEEVLKYPPPSGNAVDEDIIRDIVYRAFDSAIQEIIAPVVERSITIASISTGHLIAKDFACEVDEEKYRTAARQMVKSLAGSLALVTCKEPLRMSISNLMRRPPHIDTAEQLIPEGSILMCVNDNLDNACRFVEQAAEEKAIPEIDRRIETELEERRRHLAQKPDEPFISDANLNRWSMYIPEPFRQAVGGLKDAQYAVYQDFDRQLHGVGSNHIQNASTDSTGRQIPDVLQEPMTMPNLTTPANQPALPHQAPMSQMDGRMHMAGGGQPRINGFTDAIAPQDRIHSLMTDIQKASATSSAASVKDLDRNSSISAHFNQIISIILTTSPRPKGEILARFVAEAICRSFYDDIKNQLEVEVMAHLLAKVCQMSDLVSRDVYRWLASQEDTQISNVPVTLALIDIGLLDLNRVDGIIGKALQQRSMQALALLAEILDHVLFSDEPIGFRADFTGSLETMNQWLAEEPDLKIATDINRKLRAARMPEFVTVPISDQAKAKRDQMEYVFNEWTVIYQNPSTTDRSYASFLRDMHQKQLINSTEDSADFFRLCIDACVASHEKEALSLRGSFNDAYVQTDALAKLIVMLVKHQGDLNGSVKLKKDAYLRSILYLVVLVQNHHQVTRGVAFNQRVFFRLFSSILCEYAGNNMSRLPEHTDMMLVIAEIFLTLQPAHFPAFVFAWLLLISHRGFMPTVLELPNDAGWEPYRKLVEAALLCLTEQFRAPRIARPLPELYSGTLKIMLVLYHDFPDFVSENYLSICDAVPTQCTQLRNLVLSASPQTQQQLPDPMTAGLKVERLDESKKTPSIAGDVSAALIRHGLIAQIDAALRTGNGIDAAVAQVCDAVDRPSKKSTDRELADGELPLLSSIIIYTGQAALANTPGRFDPNANTTQCLHRIAQTLQGKSSYSFVQSLFNHLRYPNTHTTYFSKLLLHLFAMDQNNDLDSELRQQIARVALERMVVQKPHPWGLLILFQELEQNAEYKFWEVPSLASAAELRASLHDVLRTRV